MEMMTLNFKVIIPVTDSWYVLASMILSLQTKTDTIRVPCYGLCQGGGWGRLGRGWTRVCYCVSFVLLS
jgi:hypothetical protein